MKTKYRNFVFLFIAMASGSLAIGVRTSPLQEIPEKTEKQAKRTENQVIKQGLSIAMAIDLVSPGIGNARVLREGDDARLKFTLRNAASQEPVKGLHPAVWMARQNPREETLSCKDRINSYLQGQMAFRPEVDLNSYFVLSLNNKASISVIDPLNGFGGSKLIARILLNSPGEDWVLSKDHKRLYVTTPLTREVAVIDTAAWKAIAFLSFDAAPTRLALQPDGKYLWVGLEPASDDNTYSGVGAIDTETNAVAGLIATGAGRHALAFSDDSRSAYVSNANDSTISIIDVAKLTAIKTIKTSSPPVSLAASALSESLYAALENGQLLTINFASQDVTARIDTGVKLKTLRITSDGRWGFALSQSADKVFIIDVSDNRLVHAVEVNGAPDQISFTDTFAYVRSTTRETVSMIQLDALGKKAHLPVTAFPAGQKAPSEMTESLLTDAIAPTPERNAVVVANPADKMVYYYMEGMAAPMGSFENFGLAPMAVMVMDRSLRETSPGVYTGMAQLPPAGSYSVSILLDSPPVFHCFSANIESNAKLAKQTVQPVTIEYLMDKREIPVGAATPIQLKINNPGNTGVKNGVADIQVLLFRIPGVWQQRTIAKPLGDGLYQVEITPPEAGVYQIFTQSPSLGFTFEKMPPLTLRAMK